jgi:hypothetical protein
LTHEPERVFPSAHAARSPPPPLSLLFNTHTAKADRLKEARAEADREIAAFKATREEAYQRALTEVRR